jgi:predicted ATPase
MPDLLRLSVQNYKSLRAVSVPLAAVNVLVGPNASGKSNLLDVIQFLGDSVRQDLEPALRSRGGFSRVLYRGRAPKGGRVSPTIRVSVAATVTKHSSRTAPDEYDLTVWQGKSGTEREVPLLARWESFKFKRVPGRGRRITVRGSRVEIIDEKPAPEQQQLQLRQDSLALATLPRLPAARGGQEVSRVAQLFSTFRVFNVDVEAARRPSEIPMEEEPNGLREDASNLAYFLQRFSREHPERFRELETDARDIVPGLSHILFKPVGGPTTAVALQLEERGLRSGTSLAEASFGTIRCLALLALLYDPAPARLTSIEEFDHGLHPYAFDLLVDRLRQASARTQFLIATHSPALVNRLNANELIVCERDSSGASRIPAVDPQVVEKIEDEAEGNLGLGEIWFTGTLGGVPH